MPDLFSCLMRLVISSSPYAVATICELAPLALLPNFIVQNKVSSSAPSIPRHGERGRGLLLFELTR